MALLAILSRPPTKAIVTQPRTSREAALIVDAFTRERHIRSAQMTEHPADDNTTFSDHVILLPVVVEVEGWLSDTPILRASRQSFKDFFGAFPGRVAGDGVIQSDDGLAAQQTLRPSREKWRRLEQIWRDREPVDLVTGLQVYRNMILTDLVAPRDITAGQDIPFNATFREFRTVEIVVQEVAGQATTSRKVSEEQSREGSATSSEVDQGTQPTDPATPQQNDVAEQTFLKLLGDKAESIIGTLF